LYSLNTLAASTYKLIIEAVEVDKLVVDKLVVEKQGSQGEGG